MHAGSATALDRRVAEIVEGGDLAQLFSGATRVRHVRDVDFGAEPPREDPDGARYVVFLHPDVPADCGALYCLFPSRDNGRERVLDARRYRGGVRCLGRDLRDLNKEINCALHESAAASTMVRGARFCVAFGNSVFNFTGVGERAALTVHFSHTGVSVGTVYVVWTYHVNRINASHVATTTYVRWPLVINMDGHHHIRRMFILKDRITDAADPRPLALMPHAPGNPVVLRLPKPIFVCESRDPAASVPGRPPLVTRTWAQAMALVTAPAVRAGVGGDLVNPFSRRGGGDLCNDGGALMSTVTAAAGGTISVDEDASLSSSSSGYVTTPDTARARGGVLGLIPEGASSTDEWVQVDALFDPGVREPPERSPFEPDTPEEARVRRERREDTIPHSRGVPPLALREDEIVV